MWKIKQKFFVWRTKSLKQRLIRKIEKKGYLSEREQLKIFTLPPRDAKEVACVYCNVGYFYPRAQLKFFKLPPKLATEVVLKLVEFDRSNLCPEAEVELFNLPREAAEEIFGSIWMRDYQWSPTARKRAKDLRFLR